MNTELGAGNRISFSGVKREKNLSLLANATKPHFLPKMARHLTTNLFLLPLVRTISQVANLPCVLCWLESTPLFNGGNRQRAFIDESFRTRA